MASVSQSTALHVIEGKKILKIGILEYTPENYNYYTQAWTMYVDCIIDKKDLETFLPAIEKKQKIEIIQANAFSKNELVFELQKTLNIIQMILLLLVFIFIPVSIHQLLDINNDFIQTALFLLSFATFIYFIIKKSKKPTGFYLSIQNGLISFLHLASRKEIFSTSINNVNTSIYIIRYKTQYSPPTYYLTMKLEIPGFKNITIAQASHKINIWKNNNLKVKSVMLSVPDYIIDAENWDKLAHVFGIHV